MLEAATITVPLVIKALNLGPVESVIIPSARKYRAMSIVSYDNFARALRFRPSDPREVKTNRAFHRREPAIVIFLN
jgi:hypothetical protein